LVVSGVEQKVWGNPEKIGDVGLQGPLMPEMKATITSSSMNTDLWSTKR
jgi:hypothetical protein